MNKERRQSRAELHRVARQNPSEQMLSLIDQGMDINAKDDDGATPLHWAALLRRHGG